MSVLKLQQLVDGPNYFLNLAEHPVFNSVPSLSILNLLSLTSDESIQMLFKGT